MKVKINTDNSYGGFYSDDSINDGWNMTIEIPNPNLLMPFFHNGKWIEGAKEQDFNNKKQALISELKQQQFNELRPTDFYFIRCLETGVEVPKSVTDERTAIRLKYKDLEDNL